MFGRRTITVICVPQCGHARAVRELLRRRQLPFVEQALTADDADTVIATYHLYCSPVLLINGEVISGVPEIMGRIESLAAGR